MLSLCRPSLTVIVLVVVYSHLAISETSKQNEVIDTDQIIYPALRPLIEIFDILQENAKALEYADKVEKERNENMLPKSVFDLLVPKPSTTTPRPLIERLFEPLFEPLKSELNKLNKASSLDEEKLKKTTREPLRLFRDQVSPPELMLNSDSVRRSPHERVEEELTSPFPHTTVPLISLLEPLGQNARRREQVEVGRDRSVNVLGMPVGRRDGLLLSPLKGLSLGNQDMYGPISINDKYNVNWGFFDKLGTLFNSATQQLFSRTKA